MKAKRRNDRCRIQVRDYANSIAVTSDEVGGTSDGNTEEKRVFDDFSKIDFSNVRILKKSSSFS